jgi:hypothetical protein
VVAGILLLLLVVSFSSWSRGSPSLLLVRRQASSDGRLRAAQRPEREGWSDAAAGARGLERPEREGRSERAGVAGARGLSDAAAGARGLERRSGRSERAGATQRARQRSEW